MANAPVRATKICSLRIGEATIPIKTFRGYEDIGLSGSLFHENCGGKIISPHICELHPDEDFPTTFSAIKVGTDYIRLDKEDRKELLGKNCDFTVESSHKLNSISSLLSGKQLIPFGIHQMTPDEGYEAIFASLLYRLSVKKRFLLLSGPVGIERYSMLMPDGSLFPLLYKEEVRLPKFEIAETDTEFYKLFDSVILSYDSDFPAISGSHILDRISAWMAPQASRKARERVKAGLQPVIKKRTRTTIREA